MTEPVGWVVVEYNQASHRPGLPPAADLYDTAEDAEHAAEYQRTLTANVGRGERYAVAELHLLPEYDEEGPR